jgi:hypothetical protein
MPQAFTSVVTAVFTTMTTVVTTIADSPLLLIPVGVGFAGSAIGLAKSLMGTRRKRR